MFKTTKNILAAAVAAVATMGLGAPSASAGDDRGDFMIRILGTGVLPDVSADVSLNGTLIPGANADVSKEFIPATTLTYFFNDNLSAELFCCFAKHQADAEGTIAPLGEIADFWIFPPALTLQYHFTGMGSIKPYVGAGVQYIAFFKEDTTLSNSVDIDSAFGFTLQAGVDVGLGGGWFLNADVKKTWLDTEVHWRGVGGVNGVNIDADVDVDPWIVSVGLGYRFNLFGRRYAAEEPLK